MLWLSSNILLLQSVSFANAQDQSQLAIPSFIFCCFFILSLFLSIALFSLPYL